MHTAVVRSAEFALQTLHKDTLLVCVRGACGEEKLQKTQSQLTDVDRRGRKLISSMRNEAREEIAEVREYVQQQKQNTRPQRKM